MSLQRLRVLAQKWALAASVIPIVAIVAALKYVFPVQASMFEFQDSK